MVESELADTMSLMLKLSKHRHNEASPTTASVCPDSFSSGIHDN